MAVNFSVMRPLLARLRPVLERQSATRRHVTVRRIVAGSALSVVTGALGFAKPVSQAQERTPYAPPPRLGKSFESIPKAMPLDESGQLAWAVKNLEVDIVRQVLNKWPHGAALLDDEDNTLFHLAASQGTRCAAQPTAVKEITQMLLKDGWDVVDCKNKLGERAELVAARSDPHGPMKRLLAARSHDFNEKLRSEDPLQLVWDESPVPWKWQYPVQDEQRRCYAGVLKQAFSSEQCAAWMQDSLEKGVWQSIPGVPRKVAWYVSEECADCPYRYSGLEYPASPFPQFMLEIRKEVCSLCGIPPDRYPNSCNVNIYDDHKQNVGWHSDDEIYFQGLNADTRIISFSLGVPRDFCWRLQGTTQTIGSVPLGDGDIMTMEGLFQKHYKHSVPASEKLCGKRINMTFRWIVVKAHAADAETKGVSY